MPALPDRPPRRRTESTVKARIRAAICAVPGVICWPNACGQYRDDAGHVIQYGLARGSSDLILCAWGRFVAIECKREQPAWTKPTSRAKPTEHEARQLAWIAQVESFGGVGGIAWDVPSAMAILERARPVLPVANGR